MRYVSSGWKYRVSRKVEEQQRVEGARRDVSRSRGSGRKGGVESVGGECRRGIDLADSLVGHSVSFSLKIWVG